MVSSWKFHSRGRSIDPRKFKNGNAAGAASLRNMALRSCCWNKHLFTPEALQDLGWYYAGMIYRRLVETFVIYYLLST